ncbi:MAG: MFS transporter [Eggerthellaceae bacterium]|nr:MFS transporter [Eggerthellaceae bacterium]
MISQASQPEKLWTPGFILGTVVNFTLLVNYYMLMVVMTSYAMAAYNAPASLAAFCASIFIVGTLIARFVSGPLISRFNRKVILGAGVVCEIAFTCLYLADFPLVLLMGLRFLHGLAYGCCSTTISTVVTGGVPASRKGEGVGYFMLSVTLGAALGPFVGIFVSNTFGYHLLFITAASVSVLSLLCTLALKVPPAPLTSKKAAAPSADAATSAAGDASAPERPAAASNASASENPAAARTGQPAPSAPRKAFSFSNFIERNTLPVSIVCGVVFFGYSSLLTFLTPFATERDLMGAASIFFIVYAASMFVTRPFTGRAFDRRGAAFVMVPAFLVFAVGMVVLAFSTADWMVLVAALLLGYGVGTVQSSGLAVAVRRVDDTRLSLANSTFYMCLDVGVGIGPLLLGLLVPYVGYANLYLCMAGVGIAALALFLVINRKK